MTKLPDGPTERWPEGPYVCTSCHKQLKQQHFPGDGNYKGKLSTVCYACSAESERDKLASEMAVRKAVHEKERIARLRKLAKKGGIARGKQKAAEAKARRKIVADAKKKLARDTNVVAKQLEPAAMAELELASRTLARRSLLHYTERNVPNYEAGWVHEDICRRLEQFMRDVEDRKSPRLMLWMPPRHGKSELASTQYPSWVLGHHPNWEFISTSYSVELPLKFSRKIRAKINSKEYKAVFPKTSLAKDSQSAEAWRTGVDGGYRAAGVGGGIGGMGAHILVVDDPVKDHEDADSENSRERVWDWFGSTAYTRLAPGGGVLVIQTRWHDDDLSGRLERMMVEGLKEARELDVQATELKAAARTSQDRKDAEVVAKSARHLRDSIDVWEIVKYPAIATHDEYLDTQSGRIVDGSGLSTRSQKAILKTLRKKGQALHPARFPLPLLSKYKRTLQPRHWHSLYQQNPVPDEGIFFTKDMIRYRPSLPDSREMLRFAAWDLAVGQKTSSDWTVGIVGALDWDDNLWIIDMIRGKWNTHQIAKNIIDLHNRYNLVLTGIEKGQLELAVMPQLQKLMRETGSYISLAEGTEALRPISDKVVRARPLQGRMQQGKIIFPMDQPWVETATSELLRFPTGVHDDIVDSLAWLVRLVKDQEPPMAPATRRLRVEGVGSWRDRLDAMFNGEKHFMSR